MLNLEKVKKRYNRYICRQCLNQRYNVHLVPDDCIYDQRDDCPRCKQEKNIVSGLKFSGKMKMLFK